MQEYGFSEIVEEMIKHRKPLVGHNWFFDMVYFYRQFIGSLPDTYKEFKEKWTAEFPLTFDTKHICGKYGNFANSGLEFVYKQWVENKKFQDMLTIKFEHGFDNYKKETKCHEAGYDAHMTGYIFTLLCKYQEIQYQLEAEKKELAGVDIDNLQDSNTDDSGDQKLLKEITRERKKTRINVKHLEECNLKIVKNFNSTQYFNLNTNSGNDDSENLESKITESNFDNENTIWVELDNPEHSNTFEEQRREFGDTYVEKRSSTAYLVEIKDLNRTLYESVNHLIQVLNENSQFHAKVLSYEDYAKQQNNEHKE